jgi:predicted component of type VI protein secretion system
MEKIIEKYLQKFEPKLKSYVYKLEVALFKGSANPNVN